MRLYGHVLPARLRPALQVAIGVASALLAAWGMWTLTPCSMSTRGASGGSSACAPGRW